MLVFRTVKVIRITCLAVAIWLLAGTSLTAFAAAPDQTLLSVTGVAEQAGALSCPEGQGPALLDYPSKVRVSYENAQGESFEKEIPVQWDFGDVDFLKAGSYKVTGTFTEETLKGNGLSNPRGLTASMTVLVQRKENISTLTAAGIDVEASGRTTVRLRMPILPWEAKTLYVYSSTDGKYWQRMYVNRTNGQAGTKGEYNFSKSAVKAPPYQYVVCHYMTDYRPIMFRVEVQGSPLEGMSNSVRFEEPAAVVQGEALDKWSGVELEEDDSGNRHRNGGSGGGSLGKGGTPEGPGASEGGKKTGALAAGGGGSAVSRPAGGADHFDDSGEPNVIYGAGSADYEDGADEISEENGAKRQDAAAQDAESETVKARETGREQGGSEAADGEGEVYLSDGLPVTAGTEKETDAGPALGILLLTVLLTGAATLWVYKRNKKRKS